MRASQVLFLGALGCLGQETGFGYMRSHAEKNLWSPLSQYSRGSLRGLIVSFPEESQPLGGVVTSDIPWNLEMRHWNLFALGHQKIVVLERTLSSFTKRSLSRREEHGTGEV